MKYLRPVAFAICLVLTFTLGTLWRSHRVRAQDEAPVRPAAVTPASTTSTLGMSCAASSASSFVCVGDLDGSGTAKIMLANMNNSGSNNGVSYWQVGVYRLVDGAYWWAGTKTP